MAHKKYYSVKKLLLGSSKLDDLGSENREVISILVGLIKRKYFKEDFSDRTFGKIELEPTCHLALTGNGDEIIVELFYCVAGERIARSKKLNSSYDLPLKLVPVLNSKLHMLIADVACTCGLEQEIVFLISFAPKKEDKE